MGPLVRYAATHQRMSAAVVTFGAAAVVVLLAYFQPQDLFINHAVHQGRPAHAAVVRQGSFHSGEHYTTGVAQLLTLPNASVTLRLAPFRTSNGPAVHVWLSRAAPGAANGTIAGSAHIDLGGLKGNIGDQNYAVPRTADLSGYRTVVIWCQRFSVTFGYAPLNPTRLAGTAAMTFSSTLEARLRHREPNPTPARDGEGTRDRVPRE